MFACLGLSLLITGILLTQHSLTSLAISEECGGNELFQLSSPVGCTSSNDCGAGQCLSDGRCVCLKVDGYSLNTTSNKCEVDIDECACGTALCEGFCTNTVGSYVCSCMEGFQLVSVVNCVDLDECSSENPCTTEGGVCENTEGGYQCTCYEGYQLDIHSSSPTCVRLETTAVSTYCTTCITNTTATMSEATTTTIEFPQVITTTTTDHQLSTTTTKHHPSTTTIKPQTSTTTTEPQSSTTTTEPQTSSTTTEPQTLTTTTKSQTTTSKPQTNTSKPQTSKSTTKPQTSTTTTKPQTSTTTTELQTTTTTEPQTSTTITESQTTTTELQTSTTTTEPQTTTTTESQTLTTTTEPQTTTTTKPQTSTTTVESQTSTTTTKSQTTTTEPQRSTTTIQPQTSTTTTQPRRSTTTTQSQTSTTTTEPQTSTPTTEPQTSTPTTDPQTSTPTTEPQTSTTTTEPQTLTNISKSTTTSKTQTTKTTTTITKPQTTATSTEPQTYPPSIEPEIDTTAFASTTTFDETAATLKVLNQLQVECTSTEMKIVVSASIVSNNDDLAFVDSSCTFSQDSLTGFYNLSTSFTSCSTIKSTSGNNISYTQYILTSQHNLESVASDVGIFIQQSLLAKVVCYFEGFNSTLRYSVNLAERLVYEITGSIAFDAEMLIYTSADFDEIQSTFPLILELNEPIYFLAKLYASLSDTLLSLQECWLSPENRQDSPYKFFIIHRGCPNNDLTFFMNESDATSIAFSIPAYRYHRGDQLLQATYYFCSYIVCANQSLPNLCSDLRNTTNCGVESGDRARRSADLDTGILASNFPILVSAPDNQSDQFKEPVVLIKDGDIDATSIVIIIICTIAITALFSLAVGIAIVTWHTLKKIKSSLPHTSSERALDPTSIESSLQEHNSIGEYSTPRESCSQEVLTIMNNSTCTIEPITNELNSANEISLSISPQSQELNSNVEVSLAMNQPEEINPTLHKEDVLPSIQINPNHSSSAEVQSQKLDLKADDSLSMEPQIHESKTAAELSLQD